jgi:uncharacterized repeat protein (TIGR04076 family)
VSNLHKQSRAQLEGHPLSKDFYTFQTLCSLGACLADIPSRVKITVLRRFSTEEVFKESPVKAKYSGPCPVFKDGQEFVIDKESPLPSMPEGFCPYAWDSIFWGVIALRSNGDFLEWYEDPGVGIWSCPDGLRPAIFKLERI